MICLSCGVFFRIPFKILDKLAHGWLCVLCYDRDRDRREPCTI